MKITRMLAATLCLGLGSSALAAAQDGARAPTESSRAPDATNRVAADPDADAARAQDSEAQDSEAQDSEAQDSEAQDSEVQDSEVQDSEAGARGVDVVPVPPGGEASPDEPLATVRFAPAEETWLLQASPPWAHDQGPWQTVCDGPCVVRMPAEAYRFRLEADHPGARMPILREALAEGARYRLEASYERTTTYPDEEASIFGIVGAGAAAVAMGILGATLITSNDDGEVAGGAVLFGVGAAFVALAVFLGIDLGQPRFHDTFTLELD